MIVGVKCPKCGLMQMPNPTCKSCGAPLGGPTWRPSPPTQLPQPQTTRPAEPLPSQPPPQLGGFSKGEAIRFGWNTMASNLGFFIGLQIVVGLVYLVPAIFAQWSKEVFPLLYFLVSFFSVFLNMVIQMGLIRIALTFCDGKKGHISDLFSCLPLFFKFLLGSILYGLIVLGGTILLIVPGIIWGIQYMFFSYFIIDEDLGPMEALQRSKVITQGAKWDLFLFGLLLAGINLLGALCLLVGLIATIPATMLAFAFAYRRLLPSEGV